MINFTYLLTDISDSIDEPKYKNWLKSVIASEGNKTGDIQYIFCDDDYLHKINMTYLNHDTFTDIITFPTTTIKNIVSGEIYISIDRINENSKLHSVSFNEEFSRVLVHGILHLLGFNDHTSSEKLIMRSKEDYYLHLQP